MTADTPSRTPVKDSGSKSDTKLMEDTDIYIDTVIEKLICKSKLSDRSQRASKHRQHALNGDDTVHRKMA